MRQENVSKILNTTQATRKSNFCHPWASINFDVAPTVVPFVVNATFNVLLAVSTTALNLLVLSAIRRNKSLRFASKILLTSLVLTDLGAGVLAQPQFVTILIAKATNSRAVTCQLVRSFSLSISFLASVSLWTMTIMSIDRYIALFFWLRYSGIVTTRRVCKILVLSWVCSLFFASTLEWNRSLYFSILPCCLSTCLVIISCAYIKIYRGLRHYHPDNGAPHLQARPRAMNVAKYRHTASSMMWIQGLFLFCYLPNLIAQMVDLFLPYDFLTMCIFDFTMTLVLLNSTLNPIVYCFRLPEIRAGVMNTIGRISAQRSQ